MTSIEELLDLKLPGDVSISPNGQYVVYRTSLCCDHRIGEHRQSQIWLAEVGKAHSARQLTNGQTYDLNPRWSFDSQSIIFTSDRATPGKGFGLYSLAVQQSGSEAIALIENQNWIHKFALSPNGKHIAYLSADLPSGEDRRRQAEGEDWIVWGEKRAHSRLRLLNLETREVQVLHGPDAHIRDISWGPNGSDIVFTTTQGPEAEDWFIFGSELERVDVATGTITSLAHFAGDVRQLTHAGEVVYFIAAATPGQECSSHMLWKLDLTDAPPTVTHLAHGEIDCAREIRKVGQDLVIKVQHGLEDWIKIFDGKTLFSRKQDIRAWDAVPRPGSAELILAVIISTTNKPGEVYTTTTSSDDNLVELSTHGSPLADRTYGTSTLLTCPTSDGDHVDGVFLTPNNQSSPAKPLPAIVLIHGGPYFRVTESFYAEILLGWDKLMQEAGYAVLIPNYRGSCSRGEAFVASTRGDRGTQDYADVITFTQHAVSQGLVDPNRLLVAGWSMGGCLTYLSAVRNGLHGHGWRFVAGIAGAGITDWDTRALTSVDGDLLLQKGGQLPWATGDVHEVHGRHGSALWAVQDAAKAGRIPPMLLLHGQADVNVPVEQTVGFQRALKHWKLPFECVIYPRQGHVFAERKHWIDHMQRVVRFCKRHLG